MISDTEQEDLQEPIVERSTIKDWPVDERPREKLMAHGPAALTDAELLTILIRHGTKEYSALDLAKDILREGGNLRGVAGMSVPELMRVKGIGKTKAVELQAAFELGRRLESRQDEGKVLVRAPEDVAKIMIPKLRDLTTEEFYVLILDAKNGVRKEVKLTSGTLNASLVHPREVFKAAIDHRAAAIIVVHNHPSGNLEPSREDIDITRQLVEAGKTIGIPLHDHVIVSSSGYTSLAERGFL